MVRITRKSVTIFSFGLLAAILVACIAGFVGAGTQAKYRSPGFVVLSPDGSLVYSSDRTSGCIEVLNAASGKKLAELSVGGSPTGMAMSRDGKTLYVAVCNSGKLIALSTGTGKILSQAKVGVRPMSVVLGPKTGRVYVCNRASNTISVVDARTLKLIKAIPVTREPQFAALSADESTLVVSNSLPIQASDAELVSGAVSIIDTKTLAAATNLTLCNGATNLRGVAIDPTGSWAYCVHTVSRFNLPTTQLDRGWMNTSGMSIINLKNKKVEATVLLDSVDKGAADPYSIVISPDGKKLFVSIGGNHEIESIDLERFHKLFAGEDAVDTQAYSIWKSIKESPAAKEELVNDLSALSSVGLSTRFACGGIGPRGMAISPNGKTLYVANYFSGTVSKINTENSKVIAAMSVGAQPKESQFRMGERLFADASICFQSWQSCSTCHPDARADGLRWDLMNDGIGNPKKTRSMVHTFKTSPVMAMGVRADAKTAVRAGFKFILFTEVPDSYHNAVDVYLKALATEPSPVLAQPNAAVARGKKIFFGKAQCAGCHSGPLHTDLKPYKVIPEGPYDKADDKFITPKLVEVYRSGPYLHDGRASSLKDMLIRHNPKDRHGMTSKLSPSELSDLITYLQSL